MEMSSVSISSECAAIAASHAVGLSGEDLALALLEQSEDCVKLLSIDGHLEFMNCAGLRAMEIENPAKFIGNLWWDLWPTHSRAQVCEEFRLAAAGNMRVFEADCPTAQGSPRSWVVSLKPLIARQGSVVSILCTSRDVTTALS